MRKKKKKNTCLRIVNFTVLIKTEVHSEGVDIGEIPVIDEHGMVSYS